MSSKYNDSLIILTNDFYKLDTISVAEELLGKYVVRRKGKKEWIGKIVETEAYIGPNDPGSHAYRGLTPRTKIMYGPGGHAYVYFTYGMHFMLNAVTEVEGFPAAVLIRALEPISGFDENDPRPASGPGKLCKNMEIDRSLNGISLQSTELWIGRGQDSELPKEVRWSKRIGLSAGADKLWRAYLFGNPFVSRKSNPSDSRIPSQVKGRRQRKSVSEVK
jgi:DNA-3-methyladenine glycosylase